jgi:hypothetical protein
MTGRVDPATLARAIETELERTGSPERAVGENRYLKSDMDFLAAGPARDVDDAARRGVPLDRAANAPGIRRHDA